MDKKPELNKNLDEKTFREYYYLKEELVAFCKENNLPTVGSKPELTERIAYYLKTGGVLARLSKPEKTKIDGNIDENTVIESGITFSEKHRAFFESKIGKGFSFNVPFQNWLKSNAGKTYGDAVEAYGRILKEKKTCKTTIGSQFEYNTYIRDFFADNEGKSLSDAIACWKYKKSIAGNNKYERADLVALEK